MSIPKIQIKDLMQSFGWSAAVVFCGMILAAISGGIAWIAGLAMGYVGDLLLKYPIVILVITIVVFWGVKVDTKGQNKGKFLRAQGLELLITIGVMGSAILLCAMIWAYGALVVGIGQIMLAYPVPSAILIAIGITLFAITIYRTPDPDYDAYYYPFD